MNSFIHILEAVYNFHLYRNVISLTKCRLLHFSLFSLFSVYFLLTCWSKGTDRLMKAQERGPSHMLTHTWLSRLRSRLLLHLCTHTLSHFLRSSICSTSLDSSTTLPLIMVWVTTFTIFLVLTSGSSVKQNTTRVIQPAVVHYSKYGLQ